MRNKLNGSNFVIILCFDIIVYINDIIYDYY